VPALIEPGNPEYDEARTRWSGVRRQIAVVRLRTDTELAPQPHVPTTRAGSV
jgi:hypothetical protein